MHFQGKCRVFVHVTVLSSKVTRRFPDVEDPLRYHSFANLGIPIAYDYLMEKKSRGHSHHNVQSCPV